MASADQDLVRLFRVARLLETEDRPAPFKLEELYRMIFENEEPRNRVFKLSDCSKWDELTLFRALHSIEEIVTRYVKAYHDPHSIPVTHYKRQKRIAIHLDEQFKPVLREVVTRSGPEKLQEADGTPARDSFLDEPILFLKQEARAKGFPRTKKGGGPSLKTLKERFEMKLLAKGAHLSPESSNGFGFASGL